MALQLILKPRKRTTSQGPSVFTDLYVVLTTIENGIGFLRGIFISSFARVKMTWQFRKSATSKSGIDGALISRETLISCLQWTRFSVVFAIFFLNTWGKSLRVLQKDGRSSVLDDTKLQCSTFWTLLTFSVATVHWKLMICEIHTVLPPVSFSTCIHWTHRSMEFSIKCTIRRCRITRKS